MSVGDKNTWTIVYKVKLFLSTMKTDYTIPLIFERCQPTIYKYFIINENFKLQIFFSTTQILFRENKFSHGDSDFRNY